MLTMTTSKTSFKLLGFILLISIFSADAMPVDRLHEKKDEAIVKRQASSDYQCSSGPTFNSTLRRSSTAGRGPLYVDTDRSAQCSGRVTAVEMCFTVDHQSSAAQSIDLVILRRLGGEGSDFRVVDSLELLANNIDERDDLSNTDGTICQNITVTNTLMVSEGNFIGFACRNSIRVAYAILPKQSGRLRSATIEPVFGLETITDGQLLLDSRADSEFPLLRAVIEGRNTETPTTPSNNECNGNGNGNDGDGGGRIPELNTNNIYNTTFTSFVVATIVAIIIIFVLILVICGMGMSMLKMKFKCLYNLCRCCCGKKKKNKGIIRKIMHV